MNPSRLVTIKDVAKEAGVSIGAVSKVLHGRGGNIRVSEATSQRIRDAARTLSYRPNYHARSLRSGKSRSVGVIASSSRGFDERGLYHNTLIDRLMVILHEKGYTLNFAPELMPLMDIRGLSDGRFDGLVWLDGAPTGPLFEAFYESPVPVVGIGGIYSQLPERGALFLTDEEESYRLLLDHLGELGHKRILYSGPAGSDSNALLDARCDGFTVAARERGMDIAAHVSVGEAEAISHWRGLAERPTVIVAHSDRWGAMLMYEAYKVGISIPGDLSLAAFDGSPISLWAWPGLTTIRPPLNELVDRATDHLIRQMEREPADPIVERFSCTLDVAGSTAPPTSVS